MALDAITLALTADELRQQLAGARIDKIYQPAGQDVVLHLRTQRETSQLLISARPGSARVCLTDERYDNPQTPPPFCMLLRKHLGAGRVVDIRTEASERIVYFVFLCTNEMGDLVYNTLCAELMGRHCNMVLVASGADEPSAINGGKILDALSHVSLDDSAVRQLLPGLPYTLPPQREKGSLIESPLEAFLHAITTSEQPLAAAVQSAAGDIGPVVAREVAFRTTGSQTMAACALSAPQHTALQETVAALREDYQNGGNPTIVYDDEGEPIEFSFTPLTQYLPRYTLTECADYSTMLEVYYAEKDRINRLRSKSKSLRITVQNALGRAQRKHAARLQDREKSKQSDQMQLEGELLTANLHTFERGDASVTVHNWYTDEPVTIELDRRLSPSDNAQKRFKSYKKMQTAQKKLRVLIYRSKREIEYLESIMYQLDGAENDADLEDIQNELRQQSYLRRRPTKKRRKEKPAGFLRYRSGDGFLILVGRNNRQNDQLTLKTARGKDLWFHTQNGPGSHVVVMSEGKDIPQATQDTAAQLAVWHSKQRHSANVAVDCTEVKNIRKTAGLPPGMVLYENQNTVFVTVGEEDIAAIARAD